MEKKEKEEKLKKECFTDWASHYAFLGTQRF